MDPEEKEKRIAALREIQQIKAEGYAGILPNGNIVDRRKHPKAIPMQENSLLKIPKPKPLPTDR